MSGMVFVSYGHLLKGDPSYGLPVACYVCAARHTALGVAGIQDKSDITYVPLCEQCVLDPVRGDSVVRKYVNVLDLEIISEGKDVTAGQILAMAEKQDMAEH